MYPSNFGSQMHDIVNKTDRLATAAADIATHFTNPELAERAEKAAAAAERTTELTRRVTVARTETARTDTKAQGLGVMVSLLGGGSLALGSATGAFTAMPTIAFWLASLAATAAAVVIGLVVSVIWPVAGADTAGAEHTTTDTLHAQLRAEHANVAFIAENKFAKLRWAIGVFALTGLFTAATVVATVIGSM